MSYPSSTLYPGNVDAYPSYSAELEIEQAAPWFLGPIDMDPPSFSSSIDLTR